MRDLTTVSNTIRSKNLKNGEHYELWFVDNILIPFKVSAVKNGIERYERQGGCAIICDLARHGMNKLLFMHTVRNFLYEGVEIAENLISEKIYVIDHTQRREKP